MIISLKKDAIIYVNGAKIRVDRKVKLEFLNRNSFLLDDHILTSDEANNCVKQLYFIIQNGIINPQDGDRTRFVSMRLINILVANGEFSNVSEQLSIIKCALSDGNLFHAIKGLKLIGKF
jgi:flagellar biosynthesis regulator FlbT